MRNENNTGIAKYIGIKSSHMVNPTNILAINIYNVALKLHNSKVAITKPAKNIRYFSLKNDLSGNTDCIKGISCNTINTTGAIRHNPNNNIRLPVLTPPVKD